MFFPRITVYYYIINVTFAAFYLCDDTIYQPLAGCWQIFPCQMASLYIGRDLSESQMLDLFHMFGKWNLPETFQ
jgi:hypothetical protein